MSTVGVVEPDDSYPLEEAATPGCFQMCQRIPLLQHYIGEEAEELEDPFGHNFGGLLSPSNGSRSGSNMTVSRSANTTLSGGTRAPATVLRDSNAVPFARIAV